jgi:phosphate transport system substrate-binding protein
MNVRVRIAAAAAALSLLAVPAVSFSAPAAVHVAGTTNLTAVLTKAAAAYKSADPSADVDVKGTSSGAGIASIKAGEIDVAASDAAVNDPDLIDTSIGTAGIALLANPATGKTNLTREELNELYSGKVRNWKQIGGADVPVVLFARPLGTGVRFVFEKKIAKEPIDVNAPASAAAMLETMEHTPGAVGYTGMSLVGTHTNLVISYEGVAPTPKTIGDGSYLFATHEHLLIRKDASAKARAFVDFVKTNRALLSAEGIY